MMAFLFLKSVVMSLGMAVNDIGVSEVESDVIESRVPINLV